MQQGSRASSSSSSSWAAVEEKMAMEFAIWKSRSKQPSHPGEEEYMMELMAGARMKVTDRGMATITFGSKLEWELVPPSGYTGYCENLRDDWLLVSRSGFRVTLHASQGTRVQVCPCNGDLESALAGLSLADGGIVSRFFTSGDTSPSPGKLRRSLSQREELIELRLSAPFQNCVNGLRNAVDLPDVLDTILGFSAVCIANEHVLQQVSEEDDDNYFYDLEGMEELRAFEMERRNDATWIRNQVREASLQCQAAAGATSEVAKVVVNMLLNKLEPIGEEDEDDDEEEAHDPMEMDGGSRIHSSSGLSQIEAGATNLIVFNYDRLKAKSPPVVDDDGLDEWEERVDGRSTSESGMITRQSVMDTSSTTSSWEYVRAPVKSCGSNYVEEEPEEEDDILGAGISDAESLAMMLRSRDPFGCNDCSHLVNEFLTLSLGSSSSAHQDPNGDENKLKKSKVLKRLESWSSSNSGWSTASTDRDSLSYVSKKRLKPLQEEPMYDPDPETSNACRSFVNRAAIMGDVLQWCSCRFNKSRSSIEMKFHVRCFMDDDIATLSTGISNALPLHIEIFLDTTNMRQSLVEGRVRVAAYQEVSEDEECAAQPVIGLSCYIPHLVRQYLQQSIRGERVDVDSFPDGQLLIGLMKHVVAKLVFLKQSCCVCNSPRLRDMVTSMVPKPCDENLCQALHDLWLVVAPRMVLESSTIESWLRACVFREGVDVDESLMDHYMLEPRDMMYERNMTYENKLEKVMLWVDINMVEGSWLKLVKENIPMPSHEQRFCADLLAFPTRNEECTDSFALALKAWQSQYLYAMSPRYLNAMRPPIDVVKTSLSRFSSRLLQEKFVHLGYDS